MKKILTVLLVLGLAAVLVACNGKGQSEENSKVIKVGATPVPHAELLELVKEDLKVEGYTLEIIEFTDYVKPNLALADKELDANFFQHVPYLESFANEHKLSLESIGTVHVEPLALYSEKIETINDLEEGATIAIPSDAVNGGRALILLQSKGLITLKEGYSLEATEADISENPKGLKFKAIEAAQLPRVLPDVDGAVINGNYALEAGLNPTESALIIEGAESPYANIIVTRTDNSDAEGVKKLLELLQTDKVKEYILENYDGGVVPAF